MDPSHAEMGALVDQWHELISVEMHPGPIHGC
jgi:hypothetical protein